MYRHTQIDGCRTRINAEHALHAHTHLRNSEVVAVAGVDASDPGLNIQFNLRAPASEVPVRSIGTRRTLARAPVPLAKVIEFWRCVFAVPSAATPSRVPESARIVDSVDFDTYPSNDLTLHKRPTRRAHQTATKRRRPETHTHTSEAFNYITHNHFAGIYSSERESEGARAIFVYAYARVKV